MAAPDHSSERMLRVQIDSLIAGIDGTETIMTTESATVGNLVAGFIFERRLRPEIISEFALQDSQGNVLKPNRTVASYGLKDGDKIYLAKNEPKILLGCRNWFALAAATFGVSLIGFAVVIYLYARSGNYPFDYVVVIDGGSTHSDLYVYQWRGFKVRGTGVVEQLAMTRCEGHGLQNYDNPWLAAKSLNGCLNFAQTKVPLDSWEKTEIYLGATAGMRMLELTNATLAHAIIDAIRTEISGNYRFKFLNDHVRIVTGVEEGTDGWITVNYLAKALLFDHISPKFSYGALDLGGASAQITYEAPVLNSTLSVNLFGEEYDLYSHSFLCYGLREAERQLKASLIQQQNNSVIENPCTPLGNSSVEHHDHIFGHFCTQQFSSNLTFDNFTFNGTSDPESCARNISELFNKTYCPYPNGGCSFNGVFEPPLHGDFVAFHGFYSVMEFFSLTNSSGSGELVPLNIFRQKSDDFCKKNWTEINILNASDPHSSFLTEYCFDAKFVDKILTEGYGFNNTEFGKIRFRENIDGTDLGWTLGLALNSTNTRDNELPVLLMSTAIFACLIIVFTVLLVFAVVFFFRALKAARRYRDYEPISSYGAI